jgi:hypothetical protein
VTDAMLTWFLSKLAGEVWPSALCRRRGLYQPSMQVNGARRAAVLVCQLRRSMSSHSSVTKKVSAIALS